MYRTISTDAETYITWSFHIRYMITVGDYVGNSYEDNKYRSIYFSKCENIVHMVTDSLYVQNIIA